MSFWLQPEWQEGSKDDASFLSVADGRLSVFKNVNFLRFEFTDDAGSTTSVDLVYGLDGGLIEKYVYTSSTILDTATGVVSAVSLSSTMTRQRPLHAASASASVGTRSAAYRGSFEEPMSIERRLAAVPSQIFVALPPIFIRSLSCTTSTCPSADSCTSSSIKSVC